MRITCEEENHGVVVVSAILCDEGKKDFSKFRLTQDSDLQDLVLLQHLSGDVKREILGIDDTANEAQILRDEFVAVVHDEDATNVKLDIVLGLLVLKQIKGGALGDVQQSLVWRKGFISGA